MVTITPMSLTNLSIVFLCFICLANDEINSIKDIIRINETKDFKEIEINQEKYQFKLYSPIINCFGKDEIKDIPADFNQSPLLFNIAMNKLLIQKEIPIHKRFKDSMNGNKNPDTKWKSIQAYFLAKGEKIAEDNLDKIFLDYTFHS
jgi:hypothetical protein